VIKTLDLAAQLFPMDMAVAKAKEPRIAGSHSDKSFETAHGEVTDL
jgi:hypothetical protein